MMDRDHLPEVKFTREELTFLQELMNHERAGWFNYYEDLVEYKHSPEEIASAHRKYELCKSIRDKVYHMNGRDTLAPGNHEQRWWDQQHDYH